MRQAPSTTIPTEDLVRGLYRLGLVQRSIARHAAAGLGSQGFLALGVVHHAGPLRVSEIASRLSVDLSVASRQVAALEQAGHVVREGDPDDRRASRIAITDAGREALRVSHERMVEAFDKALAGWSREDVAALAAGLERLRDDFTTAPQEVTR